MWQFEECSRALDFCTLWHLLHAEGKKLYVFTSTVVFSTSFLKAASIVGTFLIAAWETQKERASLHKIHSIHHRVSWRACEFVVRELCARATADSCFLDSNKIIHLELTRQKDINASVNCYNFPWLLLTFQVMHDVMHDLHNSCHQCCISVFLQLWCVDSGVQKIPLMQCHGVFFHTGWIFKRSLKKKAPFLTPKVNKLN